MRQVQLCPARIDERKGKINYETEKKFPDHDSGGQLCERAGARGSNQPETDWGMRDYFGGVGAAESLGFSVSDAALIIKDILLHYPGIALIAAKGIGDHLVV